MVDVPTISAVVAATSVVVGVVFTLLELRHLARTRRTDVIMRIYERFGNKEWVDSVTKVGATKFESLDDYRKKYGLTEVIQIATLFDGVGVLLEQNLIDIKLVDSLFGNTVNLMWEKTSPIVRSIRETGSQPSMFSHFEYLHGRLDTFRNESAKTRR